MNGEENRFSRWHGFITRYRFYITEWFRKSAELVSLRGIYTGFVLASMDLAATIWLAVKCYLCEGLGYEKFRSLSPLRKVFFRHKGAKSLSTTKFITLNNYAL